MLKFKDSVRIKTLSPVLLFIFQGLLKADAKFPEDIVVTSVNDSTHSIGSAHYRDAAVDIRCNDRPFNKDMALIDYLRNVLGPKFVILYESAGTPNEHIHIQLRKGEQWTPSSSSGESNRVPWQE